MRRALLTIGVVGLRAAFRVVRANLRRYEIAEGSMAPALLAGDWVLAVPWRRPSRGDIVVIPHPQRPGFELVKRVVGLPGDEVTVTTGGEVLVNGAAVDAWGHGPTRPPTTLTVPMDAVFVLGDAREASSGDSRLLGPIVIDTVGWQVRFRYWPRGRIGIT